MARWKQIFLTMIIAVLFIGMIPSFILADTDEKHSKIANLPISDETDEDIRSELVDKVATWMTGDDLTLASEYETFNISRQVFHFDVDGTINAFREQAEESFLLFFKRNKNIQIPLTVHIDETDEDIVQLEQLAHIDYDQVLVNLQTLAGELSEGTVQLPYDDEDELEFKQVASTKTKVGELSDSVLNNILKQIDHLLIEPGNVFSLLDTVELPKSIENSKEELSFIATLLYELFLQTNMDIVERHAHAHLPDYAKVGVEAYVDPVMAKDFIVHNDESVAYRVKGKLKQQQLQLQLETIRQDQTYEYTLENEQKIEPKTIYRYDKDLNDGEEEVIQQGKAGQAVEIHRERYDRNNSFLDAELISRDLYLPTPKIVLTSVESEATEEETIIDESGDEDLSDDDYQGIIDEDGELILTDSEEQRTLGDLIDSNKADSIQTELEPLLFLFALGSLFELTEQTDQSAESEQTAEQTEKIKELLEQIPDESMQEKIKQLEKQIDRLNEKFEDFAQSLKDEKTSKGGENSDE